jgi:hypothetical protein
MAEKKETKKTKRILIALGAGIAVAGVAMASAAGLGGIQAEKLGADTTVVASGYTGGLTVEWGNPELDITTGNYVIDDFMIYTTSGQPLSTESRLRAALSSAQDGVLGTALGVNDEFSNQVLFTLQEPIRVDKLDRISVLLNEDPI